MVDSDIHKKLYYASIQGDDSLVRELLAAGADPDEFKDNSGNTALHEAASQGNNSTVTILIDHGADLNLQNQAGETALQRAAKKEKNEVTQLMLTHLRIGITLESIYLTITQKIVTYA